MKHRYCLLLKVFIILLVIVSNVPVLAQEVFNRLPLEVIIFAPQGALEHQPVQVTAVVRNTGDRDLTAKAVLYVAAGAQPTELIGEQMLSLSAGQEHFLHFTWLPSSAGEHTLEIQLTEDSSPVGKSVAQVIALVRPSGNPEIARAWTLTRTAAPWLAALLLAGIAIGATALVLYLFQGRD